jgi:hypothetical protein
MSNTTSQMPTSPQTPAARTPKARRSVAIDAVVVRAQQTLAALPALLPAIAAKDAKAAKVRIDQAWVDQYAELIATASSAEGERVVATVDQKAATAAERQKGLELSLLLTDLRDLVATHNPDDLAAQQAYGRGEVIDPRRTSALVTIAGAYLAAWDGKWKEPAVDAGVTQATIDKIQTLRDSLGSADVAQHTVMTTNSSKTVARAAAITAVRQMTAFAVKVVTNVFGKGSPELVSVSDPRPLTNRASARKAATKAKKAAVKTAKKAKKTARLAKPGARSAALKGRAKRASIAAQAKALAAKAKPAAKKKTAKRPAAKAKKAK